LVSINKLRRGNPAFCHGFMPRWGLGFQPGVLTPGISPSDEALQGRRIENTISNAVTIVDLTPLQGVPLLLGIPGVETPGWVLKPLRGKDHPKLPFQSAFISGTGDKWVKWLFNFLPVALLVVLVGFAAFFIPGLLVRSVAKRLIPG
jgi:hypothetical protein